MQARRALGDAHLGAELLRLVEGARPQRLPGDAGGEAEVVLDLRAGAGLPAGRHGLEHHHVEPLGRAVHRGCQPRRPGADDHQVVHDGCVHHRVEPEAVGDLGVARVLQHLLTAADEDGDVAGGDVELVEQRLHVRVALDVDVLVGVAVAHQEGLHPQGRRRVERAQDHHLAEAAREQPDAPQDVRPDEQLRQLAVGLHHRLQVRRVHAQHAQLGPGPPAHQDVPPGQLGDLPGELARHVHVDQLLAGPARVHHLELPLEDDEHPQAHLTRVEEDLAGGEGRLLAEGAHPLHLRVGELRPHLRRRARPAPRARGGGCCSA